MVRRILLALLVVILSAGFCFAETKTITAASDPWPPFTDPNSPTTDPNSPTQGLSLEIVRAAFATQGYEVTMEFMPWARAEEGVKAGTYDILPNTWMTEARKASLLYSEPYAANQVKFVKRKGDAFEFQGMESLKGKTVGIIKDYGYGEAFMNNPDFKRDPVPDLLTNVKKLVAERIDLTLEDEIVARSAITAADPALLDQIEFTQNALSENKLHVTSGLKNPRCQEIVDAFNKGLAEIKANGTFDEIFARYGLK